MDEYEKLLEKAKKNLPDVKKNSSRFEIPRAQVEYVGRQTIIKNFISITKVLRRNPAHIAKFLSKELAAPATLKEQEISLLGKINSDIINKRIDEYTKEFVICSECGKPDTTIEKESKIEILKCGACGARRAVRKI
jgi:translation initiation factor 2 subunit 2